MLNRANEKQIHITETRNILTRPDDGVRITLAFRSVYEMVDESKDRHSSEQFHISLEENW